MFRGESTDRLYNIFSQFFFSLFAKVSHIEEVNIELNPGTKPFTLFPKFCLSLKARWVPNMEDGYMYIGKSRSTRPYFIPLSFFWLY
jgi:hypothetical protein